MFDHHDQNSRKTPNISPLLCTNFIILKKLDPHAIMLYKVLVLLSVAFLNNVDAQGCPAEQPDSGDSCGGLPSSVFCSYNFVTCPDGRGGGPVNSCNCNERGTFQCRSAQFCVDAGPVDPPTPSPPPPTGDDAMWVYEVPSWWEAVQEANGSQDLKACFKRQFPPTQGSSCSKKRKICYFGEQSCSAPVNGAFPTSKCTCNGTGGRVKGVWDCKPEACPVV